MYSICLLSCGGGLWIYVCYGFWVLKWTYGADDCVVSLGQEKKSLVKGEDEKRTNDGTRAVLEDR